jgi:hypothetical protein
MRLIWVAVCVALLGGCSSPGSQRYALEDTQVVSFRSQDGVLDFRLMISPPRNYARRTAERFPVIYLLDADYSFAIARNERHFNDRKQLREGETHNAVFPAAPSRCLRAIYDFAAEAASAEEAEKISR